MTHAYWPAGLEDTQVISFKCSAEALPDLVRLLQHLNALGGAGSTRDFLVGDEQFCFDGSGRHRLHEITVNGSPIQEWLEDEVRRRGRDSRGDNVTRNGLRESLERQRQALGKGSPPC